MKAQRTEQSGVLLAVIIAACVFAVSCNTGKRNNQTLIGDLEDSQDTEGLISFDQIYHLYPSPAEMLSVIDLEEVHFDGALLNPGSQSGSYLDTRSKTYNLGVYMTDLAYAALFGRHEATLDYLEVVRQLSEEIRIDGAINEAMIQKARDNVEFLDSLYVISNEAFMNILAYCDRNERSNTVVMMSAGAFTESLYLAVNLIDDYSAADLLLQHLADQKYSIDNFMAFAENVKEDDPLVAATIEDLNRIHEIYDRIDPGSGAVTLTRSEEGSEDQPRKLVIGSSGSGSQPSLSQEEFETLKAAVIELRLNMVNH